MFMPSGSPPGSLASTSGAQATVLLIDEDQQEVDKLRGILQGSGYQVVSAALGRSGLDLARNAPPELIIVDMRLPDTEGDTLCEQLAETPATAGIPIILLSGMQRPDIRCRVRCGGYQYVVRRSYNAEALLTLIERAIDQRRAALAL